MKPVVLRSWEYRDPVEVLEHREADALVTLTAQVARAAADGEIETARKVARWPLSKTTERLIKRMRIRELVKHELTIRGMA